jgi:RND family efflux transporter MFP subunit
MNPLLPSLPLVSGLTARIAASPGCQRGSAARRAWRVLPPLAAGLLLAGCGRASGPSLAAPVLPPAQVELASVRREAVAQLTGVTGTVRAVQRAQLAAKVMGAIDELPVALGQRVKAGDVLVRISAAEISARVLQAQSQLNVARRDLERERELLGKGASTADMVKGLEDRFAMTQAMVREAEAMLGYATVRAPFDGVVARKYANVGDLAAPGQPLLEVEGTEAFEVEAALPDSLAGGLVVGTRIGVQVPAASAAFAAAVTEISSSADAGAHTVLAKIAVPAGTTVRSGQFARVEVPGAAIRRLVVPATAVTSYGELERVFVRGTDGRAALRLVKTGDRAGDSVEVLSGLDEAEQVVARGAENLREGQPLEAAAPAAGREVKS